MVTVGNIIRRLSNGREVDTAKTSIRKEMKSKADIGALLPPCHAISDEFMEILTGSLYDLLLAFCDLSYSVTILCRGSTTNVLRNAAEKIKTEAENTMKNSGFEGQYEVLQGKTGSTNQAEGTLCVVGWNRRDSLIVVAFHGSVSESIWDMFHSCSDWGSNWAFHYIKAATVANLSADVPDEVEFHGGFARNYASVHNELKLNIASKLTARQNTDNSDVSSATFHWIVFVGHSRGGALTTLAAAAVKSYLMQQNLSCFHIGVLALSSPRIMHGDHSQAWVHSLIGQSNILRINVDSDIIPLLPTSTVLQFRHVGVSKLDKTKDVLERVKEKYNENVTAWWNYFSVNSWAPLHYGDSLRFRNILMFDPTIVMPFDNLKHTMQIIGQYDPSQYSSDPYITF